MNVTAFVTFWRFIASFGVGTYLGAAVGGLVAVVSGQVFAAGSTWVTALPIVMPLGAIVTGVAFQITQPRRKSGCRSWLLPKVTRLRWLWGAAAGVLLGPLAIAVGDLGGLLQPIGLPLMLIGAVITVARWVRWYRERHPTAGARAQMNAARLNRAG